MGRLKTKNFAVSSKIYLNWLRRYVRHCTLLLLLLLCARDSLKPSSAIAETYQKGSESDSIALSMHKERSKRIEANSIALFVESRIIICSY